MSHESKGWAVSVANGAICIFESRLQGEFFRVDNRQRLPVFVSPVESKQGEATKDAYLKHGWRCRREQAFPGTRMRSRPKDPDPPLITCQKQAKGTWDGKRETAMGMWDGSRIRKCQKIPKELRPLPNSLVTQTSSLESRKGC